MDQSFVRGLLDNALTNHVDNVRLPNEVDGFLKSRSGPFVEFLSYFEDYLSFVESFSEEFGVTDCENRVLSVFSQIEVHFQGAALSHWSYG